MSDRYIPLRNLSCESILSPAKSSTSTRNSYTALLSHSQPHHRTLSFSKPTPTSPSHSNPLSQIRSSAKPFARPSPHPRQLEALRIIEAHDVQNNFYFSTLDWSPCQTLGVALLDECYLRSEDGSICEVSLPQLPSVISSLKFNLSGSLLYVGCVNGRISVIDLEVLRPIRSFRQQLGRVGCIDNTEEWGFVAGSHDTSVVHYDLRLKSPSVLKLVAHRQEVCGVSVRVGKVASGSNDGEVLVWDLRNKDYFRNHRLHRGAVKALKWCPWKINVLASGGGSNDHKIIGWNCETEEREFTIDGESQVTGLAWRSSTRDLVTSHGGKSGVCKVWSSHGKQLTHRLVGHTDRIISLAVNPSKDTEIGTLSADETLRMWSTGKGEQ